MRWKSNQDITLLFHRIWKRTYYVLKIYAGFFCSKKEFLPWAILMDGGRSNIKERKKVIYIKVFSFSISKEKL